MKKQHIYLVLCFLWMILIFMFSNQPADDSQSLSNGVLEMIERVLHIPLVEQGDWLFDTASFIVRKVAHMSEYAILAMLYSAYLKEQGIKNYWLYALVGVFLYASLDEFHQLFIDGRSGQFKDVCIDSFGGILGLCVQQVYYKRKIKP